MRAQDPGICTVIILLALCLNGMAAEAIRLQTRPKCIGATVRQVRINGCTSEPCTIRKGTPLLFEVDLSYENDFGPGDMVHFDVFSASYGVPPSQHGDVISQATCEQGTLGFSCPIMPNTKYTIKSAMMIDEKAACINVCEKMGPGGTGERTSLWRFSIYNRQMKGSYAGCYFSVKLNIVE